MHNNLETAFEAAAQLGIPKLLDVEDVADFAVRGISPSSWLTHRHLPPEPRPVLPHDVHFWLLPLL